MTEDNVTSIQIEPDSLIDLFVAKEWPGKIGLWRAALQVPMPPEFSEGGIAIPDEYREDQEYAAYIGNVRAMGPLCFKSKTRGGVELSTDEGFKVGDWVMIGKHQGEKFRTRDNTLWIVISDTQYIAVLDDPAAFDCMSL
jgi:co-chaperonin GroES (HSP10)